MPELIRSFIAVKVPDYIADELEGFIDTLRPLSKIRWVNREQYHITLKFLGEVEPEIIEKAKTKLLPLKRFEPFTIELSHAGAFPNMHNPRVLWLSGSQGARELTELSRKVNAALSEYLPVDDKKFKAHLTLSRLKGEILTDELIQRLQGVKKFSWSCDELVMMKSVLTPKGPIYSQLL